MDPATISYDPFTSEIRDDPFPTYRVLRDHAPVYRNAEQDFWAVSRYHDVQAVSRDCETFSTRDGVDLDGGDLVVGEGDFLVLDPPRHDVLRDVIRKDFAPKAVRELEPAIQAWCDGFVTEVASRRRADLAGELAWPLPTFVISELLAVPAADRQTIEDLLKTYMSRTVGSPELPPEAIAAGTCLRSYFSGMLEERRTAADDDIVGRMLVAQERGQIDEQEAIGMCFLLYAAGIGTVASLISNGLYLLALHPDERAKLVDGRADLGDAIEELLRYESPVQFLGRVTTRDAELHGVTVPAGERVLLLYGSANRDERNFEDADRLDLLRPRSRHLAFGEGIHFCLGGQLARLEARIAIASVLAAVPGYEQSGPIERYTALTERGLVSLPVSW